MRTGRSAGARRTAAVTAPHRAQPHRLMLCSRKGQRMSRFRDSQSRLAHRLRVLAVVLVVVAVVLETPLRGLGIAPAWLNPGGTGATSGAAPTTGEPAAPDI